jgi:hypothetical protein
MKNVHLLKTDKPSRLFKDDFGRFLYSINIDQEQNHFKPQNIYIISNEKPKNLDICMVGESHISTLNTSFTSIEEIVAQWRKIILTTDQELIKDGVQAIDDEFLEWFVKNPSCEFVEVEQEKSIGYAVDRQRIFYGKYKIIIPKEEPKQEKLEEYIFKIPFDYNIKPKEVIDMCMKEQDNIILTWRLGYFIDMINSLPDDTEKNRILKSVFDNRDGELLLESYKSMKKHYEK